MHFSGGVWPAPNLTALAAIALITAVAACSSGGTDSENPWAPGINHRAEAEDGLEVGHRLMAAGEHELALEAYTRAALDHGLTADVLSGMGSANLGLRRLGQAETLLRRAVAADPEWPAAMNNLGVVLMEQEKYAEAEQVLRRAYALDNGQSDSIRENLRLALAKLENPVNTDAQNEEYNLVQRGGGNYLIRLTP